MTGNLLYVLKIGKLYKSIDGIVMFNNSNHLPHGSMFLLLKFSMDNERKYNDLEITTIHKEKIMTRRMDGEHFNKWFAKI